MTDMTLDEAVSTVARFSKMFEAVQVLAGAVTDVSKIDNLTQEAEQRRAARSAEAIAAETRLNELNRKIDETIARDQANSGQILAQAQEAATRTLKQAQDEAQAILEQATRMAGEAKAKADAEINPLIAKADAARSEYAELTDKIEGGRKQLQELEAKIAQARDTISQLMRV